MKQVLLSAGLILIALMAIMNISLLWEDNGIGQWISGIFSSFAVVLPVLMLFIKSNSKWVVVSRLLAIATFVMPVLIEVLVQLPFHFTNWVLLLLNVILFPLCIMALSAINFKNSPIKSSRK